MAERRSLYRRGGKRLLDLALAIPALTVLAPLLAVVALAVRLRLGRRVLFRQPRPGRGERVFRIFKFRTMTDERDADGNLLPDSERRTPLGDLLRSFSLDELPELLNVVRGEMSLVGPRPLRVRYLPHYDARERLRFTVRPGITGLSQISGRNELSWDERLELDARYVERMSLSGDLAILAKTLLRVARREGFSADPRATMLDLDQERRQRGA